MAWAVANAALIFYSDQCNRNANPPCPCSAVRNNWGHAHPSPPPLPFPSGPALLPHFTLPPINLPSLPTPGLPAAPDTALTSDSFLLFCKPSLLLLKGQRPATLLAGGEIHCCAGSAPGVRPLMSPQRHLRSCTAFGLPLCTGMNFCLHEHQ